MAGVNPLRCRRSQGFVPSKLQDNDYPTKPLPWRTIEVTSLVVSFTTMYVHIFALDLARADVSSELCFERNLLNPTIGSFLLEDAIQKSLDIDPIGSNSYSSVTPSFRFTVHTRTCPGVIRIKHPFRLSGIALPATSTDKGFKPHKSHH